MKLVKVTAWRVPDPDVGHSVETDKFFDGWLAGEPERAYEIVDGEKVLLNIHYEAYWKNGLLASKGTFIDGLRQGFWQRYYENGNISSRCFLIDYWSGARAQLYDENGQSMKPSGVK